MTRGLTVFLSLLSGCQCVRFDSAVKQLNNNRTAYDQIATSWLRDSALRELDRFSEGEYLCNDVYLSQKAGTFTIKTDEHETRGRSFEDAAVACGVRSEDLETALDQFKALHIYGVSTETIGETKWVNVLLEGSAWTPWGLRYVRPDRPQDLAYFRKLAAAGGFHRDVCFKEIEGGWFHFESDR